MWVLYQGPGLLISHQSSQARSQITADLARTREHVVLVWPTDLAPHHFSLRSLSSLDPSQVRLDISVRPGNKAVYNRQLQNAHILETRSQRRLGFVGIDNKLLWVYLDPTNPDARVLRLALPTTTKLLYATRPSWVSLPTMSPAVVGQTRQLRCLSRLHQLRLRLQESHFRHWMPLCWPV